MFNESSSGCGIGQHGSGFKNSREKILVMGMKFNSAEAEKFQPSERTLLNNEESGHVIKCDDKLPGKGVVEPAER